MHDVLFVFDAGICVSTLEEQSPNRVLHMSVCYELNCEGTRSHPHCHLPTRGHYKMRLHRGSTVRLQNASKQDCEKIML
jgi:hypothetical protein